MKPHPAKYSKMSTVDLEETKIPEKIEITKQPKVSEEVEKNQEPTVEYQLPKTTATLRDLSSFKPKLVERAHKKEITGILSL